MKAIGLRTLADRYTWQHRGCILPRARHKLRLGHDRSSSLSELGGGYMALNVAAKPILLTVRILAGVFLYLACASPTAAQNLEKTRLGITHMSFTFLPHILARDGGFFPKQERNGGQFHPRGPTPIPLRRPGGRVQTPPPSRARPARNGGVPPNPDISQRPPPQNTSPTPHKKNKKIPGKKKIKHPPRRPPNLLPRPEYKKEGRHPEKDK